MYPFGENTYRALPGLRTLVKHATSSQSPTETKVAASTFDYEGFWRVNSEKSSLFFSNMHQLTSLAKESIRVSVVMTDFGSEVSAFYETDANTKRLLTKKVSNSEKNKELKISDKLSFTLDAQGNINDLYFSSENGLLVETHGNVEVNLIKSKEIVILKSEKNIRISDGIYSRFGIAIDSSQTLSIGRIDTSKNVAFGEQLPYDPAFIASEGDIFLHSQDRINLHSSEIRARNKSLWIMSNMVDHVAGYMSVYEDMYLLTPLFEHRVIYETLQNSDKDFSLPTVGGTDATRGFTIRGTKVQTPSAEAYIYGRLNSLDGATLKIIGSTIFCNKIDGHIPNVIETVFQNHTVQVQNHGGHRKTKKRRWHNEDRPRVLNELTYTGKLILLDDLDVDAQKQIYNHSGKLVVSGHISAKIDRARIGVSDVNTRIIPAEARSISDLFTCKRNSKLYKTNEDGRYMPTVDLMGTTLSYPKMVIVLPDGKLKLSPDLDYARFTTPEREIEELFPKLSEMLCDVNLFEKRLSPIDVWYKLQHNAAQWFAGNSHDYNEVQQPILLYKVDNNLLKPVIVMPKFIFNSRLISDVGGWFAESMSIDANSYEVYGYLVSQTQLNLEIKDVQLIKHIYQQSYYSREERVTRSNGFKKCKHTETVLTESIIMPGAEIVGAEVDLTASRFTSAGGKMLAVDGDISYRFNEYSRTMPAIGVSYNQHHDSGGSAFKRISIDETLERHEAEQSIFFASKDVNVLSVDGDAYDSSTMYSGNNINLDLQNGSYTYDEYTLRESLPTQIDHHRMLTTESKPYIDRAILGNHSATHNLSLKAKSSSLTGGHYDAEHINFCVEEDIDIYSYSLSRGIDMNTSGFDDTGLTYVNTSTGLSYQVAAQPTFSFRKSLNVESLRGSVGLQSARILGEEDSTFSAKAASDVEFSTIRLYDVNQSVSDTVGISFTGSKALSAAINKDAQGILTGLASEIPVLNPIVDATEHGHREEIAGELMHSVLRAREVDSWSDYLKGSFGIGDKAHLKFSVRFGKSTSKSESTNVEPNIISVSHTTIESSGDAFLNSTQITGKTAVVDATNVEIKANKELKSTNSTSKGISVGVANGRGSAGVDFGVGSGNAEKSKVTQMNLSEQLTLSAKEELTVSGVEVTTEVLELDSKRSKIFSDLDEQKQRATHGSLSIDGAVGVGHSKQDAKWVEYPTTLKVGKLLTVNSTESFTLRGAIIDVAEGAAGTVKTPKFTSEEVNGYERSEGYGLTAGGLWDKEPEPGIQQDDTKKLTGYVAPVMYSRKRSQHVPATLIGNIQVITPEGEDHDLSGVNNAPDQVVQNGRKQRAGIALPMPIYTEQTPKQKLYVAGENVGYDWVDVPEEDEFQFQSEDIKSNTLYSKYTSLREHSAVYKRNKNGKSYFRDKKTGRFRKSPIQDALDSVKNGERDTKMEAKVILHQNTIFDGVKGSTDLINRERPFGDERLTFGVTSIHEISGKYELSRSMSSIKGSIDFSGSVALNLLDISHPTKYYSTFAQMSVLELSGKLTTSFSIKSESMKIQSSLGASASLACVTGSIESLEICKYGYCGSVIIHSSVGVGTALELDAGLHFSNKSRKSFDAFLNAKAGMILLGGMKIKLNIREDVPNKDDDIQEVLLYNPLLIREIQNTFDMKYERLNHKELTEGIEVTSTSCSLKNTFLS